MSVLSAFWKFLDAIMDALAAPNPSGAIEDAISLASTAGRWFSGVALALSTWAVADSLTFTFFMSLVFCSVSNSPSFSAGRIHFGGTHPGPFAE